MLAGACAGGLVTVLLREAPAEAPGSPPAVEAELAGVEERLDQLEAELGRAQPVSAPAVPEAVHREPQVVAEIGDIERRLAALEMQLAALGARPAGASAPDAPANTAAVPPPDPEEEKRRIAAHQQVILDARSEDKEKLAAWGRLRHMKDAWNDGVVATMVHLGLTANDPLVRADVWRQADGRSTHPAMASALLQALASGATAKAREEAAETLANYLAVTGVRQALESASTSDADPGVRRQALRSLEAKPGR